MCATQAFVIHLSKVGEDNPLEYFTVFIGLTVVEVGNIIIGNDPLLHQAFNKHRLVDVMRNVVVVKMCQWGSACHSENLEIDTHQTPLQKPVNARRNL